jgi:uncharacterized membrane protein (DUF485 family)
MAGQAPGSSVQVAVLEKKHTLLKWQLAFWFLVVLTAAVLYWGFAPVWLNGRA